MKLAASACNCRCAALAWHPHAAQILQVVLYNYPRHCGNTVGAEAFKELRARYPVLQVRLHAVLQREGLSIHFDRCPSHAFWCVGMQPAPLCSQGFGIEVLCCLEQKLPLVHIQVTKTVLCLHAAPACRSYKSDRLLEIHDSACVLQLVHLIAAQVHTGSPQSGSSHKQPTLAASSFGSSFGFCDRASSSARRNRRGAPCALRAAVQ